MTDTTARQTPDERKGLTGKAITAIVLLAAALVFVFSNLGAGPVHFLFFTFTMPTWIWFLLVLVAGVVIGSLFPWFRPKKRK